MNRAAWSYAVNLYRERRWRVGMLWGVSLATIAFPLANIYFVGRGVHALAAEQDVGRLLVACALIALIRLAQSGVTMWLDCERAAANRLAFGRLRQNLVDHSLRLSTAYYADADRSLIHTYMAVDVERLQGMATALVGKVIPAAATVAALAAAMLYLEWRLVLVLAAFAPLVWLTANFFHHRHTRLTQTFYDIFDRMARQFREFIDTMSLIKIHATEEAARRRQHANTDALSDTVAVRQRLEAANRLVNSSVAVAAGLAVLYAGNRLVTAGELSLSGLFAFLTAAALCNGPLRILLDSIPRIIDGNRALSRLHDWLETPVDAPYSGTRALPGFSGRVELRDIHHSFGDRQILAGVDLVLEPGEITALTGPNGSGKTTLTKFILGLFRPDRGQILVDGMALDEVDIGEYRRQLGVVQQQPLILTGTIAHNVAGGDADASPARLRQAIEFAGAATLVERLGGPETQVGEYGARLSGGEMQRVALARAYYRQPRLLILDEPANHLDASAVETLISALRALEPTPAVLLISHQPRLIGLAHRRYRLEHGRAVAEAPTPDPVPTP